MPSETRDEKAIFNVARQIGSADARTEYLGQACGTDSGLRARVQVLLRAYEEQASFLESPPPLGAALTIDQPASESPGTVIGPYKLIEPIGEGGMGTVWMVQQTEPVKRLVAVKLIKAGMDSRQVIARFEAERQALALMDHPNIARVLDAGTTAAGRPYFVMDLVKGVPITKYCDEHRLTPWQRLELFLPVCQAVQHAHQKGVIHRDLKPSNVLVALYDGKPVPKVIDFGVAKAAGPPLTDQTLVTGFGAIVGTLEYMSPEQAEVNQLDIDTRSDIYALGVLLYELLTGSPPFSKKELEKAGLLEMLRVIREQEPSRPSTKLSTADGLPTLAANRGTDPTRLTRLVRGELDWIVMKALEKDRSRRYQTANGFAMDVQRYLADEAVEACPPSVSYRFLKFVRRNRLVLTSAAAVVLALAMGLTVSTWLFFEERDARRRAVTAEGEQTKLRQEAEANADRAKTEATRSNQVAAFMKDMLKGVDPGVAQGRDTGLLREILDRTAGRLDKLDAAPEAEAELRGTLGNVYRALGEYPAAEAMHRKALAIREKLFGRKSVSAAESLSDLAEALRDHNEAATLQREALAIRRELLGNAHPAVGLSLYRTAMTLNRRHRGADAEPLFREALTFPPTAGFAPAVDGRGQLGRALMWQGKLAEAEEQLREGLAASRKGASAPSPQLGYALYNLADVLRQRGNNAEAEPLFREALAVHRQILSRRHPALTMTLFNFAECLRRLGKLEEAERLASEVIALGKESPDGRDVVTVVSGAYRVLGKVRRDQQRLNEAVAALRKAVELDPKTVYNYTNLGAVLRDQKKLDEAVDCYKKVIELDPKNAGTHKNLGMALRDQKKLDEAVAAFRKAIELDPKSKLAAQAYFWMGKTLEGQRKQAEAITCFMKTVELDPKWAEAHNALAWVLTNCSEVKLRDPQRGLEVARKAVELETEWPFTWKMLGWAYYRTGDWKASIEALEKSCALQKGGDPYQWFFLAMAHWQLGEKDKARESYDRAAEWMDKNEPKNLALRRFRTEAAELLAVKDK